MDYPNPCPEFDPILYIDTYLKQFTSKETTWRRLRGIEFEIDTSKLPLQYRIMVIDEEMRREFKREDNVS